MSDPCRFDDPNYLNEPESSGFYECKDCCIQWTESEHFDCCPECKGSRYYEITAKEYSSGY